MLSQLTSSLDPNFNTDDDNLQAKAEAEETEFKGEVDQEGNL